MRAAEIWVAAYLLNALWQAPLVAVLGLGLARGVRGCGAAWEHRVWITAWLMELLLPAISAVPPSARLFGWRTHPSGAPRGTVRVSVGAWNVAEGLRVHASWGNVLVLIYGTVCLYASLRLVWRYAQTSQLQRRAEPVVLSGSALATWQACCERTGVRAVVLAESAAIVSPLTCGLLQQALLLPAGLLEQLALCELGTVFAHECVHMRRHDFAKNLLYEILALPLAWHPALWFTRWRLVETREWLCDERAAEALGGERYARALLQLASLLVRAAPVRQFHAIGIFDANPLEERIMRLVKKQQQMGRVRRTALLMYGAVVAVGVCAPAWALGVHAYGGAQEPETTAPGGAHVLQVQSDVMAGNLATQVPPEYPAAARAAGVQGTVVLQAVIGADGGLTGLQLISGPPELAEAAWTAVSQWRWRPYLLNGEPTPVKTSIHVNFRLNP